MGGQDNAFTSHDVTAYYQRIAKDRLKTVMEMEADRMANLKLAEKEVATEREVIIEERRSRTENNPSSILSEQMSAALYQNHPYRIPIIGWMHEMAKLSREDALAFYKRFYAPNNAIVVVAGDVTVDEVKALAEAAYGAAQAEPGHQAAQARAGAAASRRRAASSSRTPAPATLRCAASTWRPASRRRAPGEAEALYLLMKIAANGSTSRLYQKLVSEEKIASSAGGWYSGTGLDSGTIGVYVVARRGRGPRQGRGRHRSRPARAAREWRHAPMSSSAPRRPSSPISSTSPTARARSPGATREGCAARHDHRADQQLARCHRQGDRRGREARSPPSTSTSATPLPAR